MIKAIIIGIIFQLQSVPDSVQLVNSNDILSQVKELNKQKDYTKSIELIGLISKTDSNYVAAQIALLKTFAENSQIDKALNLGFTLMKDQKALPYNFYMSFGNIALDNYDIDEAIKIYEEGLKHFPYYHPLMYNIGFSKYRQEKYTEAIKHFQEVLLLSPFYSSAHQMIGNIMAMSNQRTKAILAYLTYLAINPDENWALIRINDLVNDAYRKEGSIEISISNENFEYFDNLLRSKAALDDRFNSKIDFEAPVAQQCELLLSKLKYVKGTDDFWMNFYMPYLSQITINNQVETFIYFILTSANNEDIGNWLKKHEKEKSKLISIASDYIADNKTYNVRTVGDQTKLYAHWYHDNSLLQVVGQEHNGLNTGTFEYYYDNGRLQASGSYSNEGVKVGDWRYYHDNGQLKSIQSHNEKGDLFGKIVSYLPNGKIASSGNYADNNINGYWEWYYSCGNLKEQYPYIDDVGNGLGNFFYSTGELKVEYNVKDDQMHGLYTRYYKSGNTESSFNYVEGNISGTYTSYHPNGKEYEIGNYENNKWSGEWQVYYNNGQISRIGKFKNGNYIGEWKHYYPNGNIRIIEQFDQDSLLHGLTTWHDEDGILYCRINF